MKSPQTKVIFRKFKDDGDIIALFPAIADTVGNPYHCQCYAHVGQHGGATVNLMSSATVPAKREEYRSLLRELRGLGYNLKIVKRFSHADLRARKEQIKR